jgi:transcriptional regulator with XRE-family HTH domain
MVVVQRWSGREARLLREALRMSVREFAGRLGCNDASVSNWERRKDQARLRGQTQRDLDTALRLADPDAQERFHTILERELKREPPNTTGDARALFGCGPVTVAVPLRTMPGRARPVISSEDSRAAEMITRLLVGLGFHVKSFGIPTHGLWEPCGDTVAICGPKSSLVTARAIDADPFLAFDVDERGVWEVRERDGTMAYGSLLDSPMPEQVDSAYVARLPAAHDGAFLVIAGVHALGSVGAVDYLSRHLSSLYSIVGTRCFSMVVRSAHDGDDVTRSELVGQVRIHP